MAAPPCAEPAQFRCEPEAKPFARKGRRERRAGSKRSRESNREVDRARTARYLLVVGSPPRRPGRPGIFRRAASWSDLEKAVDFRTRNNLRPHHVLGSELA